MKAKISLGLLALAALAAPAMASVLVVTASLSKPVEAPRSVIVDGLVWNCSGESCTAKINPTRDTDRITVRACRKLAKEVGALAAYGADTTKLSDEQVTKCNTAAG